MYVSLIVNCNDCFTTACDVISNINPILTGLFETKFLLGGGVNLTPPSDLGPEGADRHEILHGCEDTSKEYCYEEKNCRQRFIYYIIIIYAN